MKDLIDTIYFLQGTFYVYTPKKIYFLNCLVPFSSVEGSWISEKLYEENVSSTTPGYVTGSKTLA